jgi:DNA-binding response OmpR family regulator
MGLDPKSRARYNLSEAQVLLLDATPMGLSILAQVVKGLGAEALHLCTEATQARELAGRQLLDLAIVDSLPPRGDGYDFVHWLRREGGEPNRFVPVIMTTSHTPRSQVSRARDCGANITIKKPFAPITLMERIIWAAKEGRHFLACESYVGPDRRFHDLGPPEGVPGRRRSDKTLLAAGPAEGDIEAVDAREARG